MKFSVFFYFVIAVLARITQANHHTPTYTTSGFALGPDIYGKVTIMPVEFCPYGCAVDMVCGTE